MTTNAEHTGTRYDQGHEKWTRRVGRILIAALTLLAGMAIFAVASDGVADPRMLPSLVAVAVFGLTALEGVALMRRRDDPLAPVGAVAMLVSLASLVASLYWFWTIELDGGESHGRDRVAGVGLVASLALGHVSLLLSGRRNSDSPVVTAALAAAVGLTVGLGVLLSLAIGHGDIGVDHSFWRMVTVTAILDLLATVLVPIIRGLQRRA